MAGKEKMEEKVIIKSERSDGKIIIKIGLAIGIIACFVLLCTLYDDSYHGSFVYTFWFDFLAGFCGPVLISLIIYMCRNNDNLIVTDKRVYSYASNGNCIDLPIDSITAISLGGLQSITITTASGGIKATRVDNREEIYGEIRKLIIKRQSPKVASYASAFAASNTDEIEKYYKNLLNSGVITQEEFDAKKKQLLGL